MQNESPANDLKEIWRHQPSQEYKMSLEEIRIKAQQLAINTRVQFFILCGVSLALIAFDAWGYKTSSQTFQRGGFALALGWTLYELLNAAQSIWPNTLARDAGLLTCVAFSRNELQRRLHYSRHVWRSLPGPILFTLIVLVAPQFQFLMTPKQWLKVAPALVLFLIWFVVFCIKLKKERRKLRQDLDELDALQENRF